VITIHSAVAVVMIAIALGLRNFFRGLLKSPRECPSFILRLTHLLQSLQSRVAVEHSWLAVAEMFEISQAALVNPLHQGCYAATTSADINPQLIACCSKKVEALTHQICKLTHHP